jgi:hypothetical protein
MQVSSNLSKIYGHKALISAISEPHFIKKKAISRTTRAAPAAPPIINFYMAAALISARS